ncbi:MAG: hypothetical protein CME19_01680 [Gemmatimonadetes bacterium]|nr:hypothetical protein [Gemmatimonadota bacterium]
MPEEESDVLVNELRTRVERLELLLMIGRMMHATSDQEELINSIALAVGHYLDADRCSVFFHDREADELYTHLAVRTDGQVDDAILALEGQQIRIRADEGIAGSVFQSSEVLNVQDTRTNDRFTGGVDNKTGYETRSILCVPLKNRRDRNIGVLQLLNKQADPGYFTADDEIFVGELVEQIGDLMELILKRNDLEKRNARLEEQMQELSSIEYLVGDRTAINAVFRHNRRIHYWTGVAGLFLLALMAVTSIGMVHYDPWRKVMLAMHTGTIFGLGHRYYYFTDTVSILTLLICLSGLLMYVYPPLNRWLKRKKDQILKDKMRAAAEQAARERGQNGSS